MKYNQYSYLSVDQKDILKELKKKLGSFHPPPRKRTVWEWFVRKVYFTYKVQIIPSLT